MQKKQINGIQQIGVGVDDVMKSFKWYGTLLRADVSVFDDDNVATYMSPYMGGKPHKKRAILAVNLQGGSGYELWQYLDRNPSFPKEQINLGDFGIFIAKVKSRDIQRSFKRFKNNEAEVISEIAIEPDGKKCFYIKDPWNNILQIKETTDWFLNGKSDVGGIFGCTIGVSDIDRARKLYSDILGYDRVLFDETGIFEDLSTLPNGKGKFRRILLTHSEQRSGGFSRLFQSSQIELIQAVDDYQPKKIFTDRYWGDIGFIHICFDIVHMDALMKECAEGGFPFSVRSSETFDMGDANGGWGYLEDPDGTLIEFVETHKVPIMKKPNIAIDLRKRDPKKPLPNWLIRALSFKRMKFD
ncbi:MAG: VOC family protein [Bacteroidales bacterium]|jgi:catechol 2,3-dioxygenase-like lactoylglutathione lyase family enzyme|nr:VOC family protein [Bacteroidales bacterium]